MTKTNLWRKGLILAYMSHSQFITRGRQGRILEAGTLWGKAWEEQAERLVPTRSQNLLSYSIKDHQPRSDTTQGEPRSLTSTVNHKMNQGLPAGHSDGSIFPADVPSSQMTVACVKLTKLAHTHTPNLKKKKKIYAWREHQRFWEAMTY